MLYIYSTFAKIYSSFIQSILIMAYEFQLSLQAGHETVCLVTNYLRNYSAR